MKTLIHGTFSKSVFDRLASDEVRTYSMDSYDLDKKSQKKAFSLFRKKAKTVYGITTDGRLFHCCPYFIDGYNPYKYGNGDKENAKREQLKTEVFNYFVDTYLKQEV